MTIDTKWFGCSLQILTSEADAKLWFIALWWKNPGMRTSCWGFKLPKFLQRRAA